jgi:hypothetical protein
MGEHYLGVLQTVWGETGAFIEAFRGGAGADTERQEEAACFEAVLAELAVPGGR